MKEKSFRTVPELFLHRVAVSANKEAFRFPVGENGWASLTWKETGERVRTIAGGLLALGIQNEQRCAVMSSTRVEWILADLGILCAAGATTTVYPSNTAEETEYIVTDSASLVVFAEDDAQVAKLVERRESLPGVKQVVVFAGTAGHDGWVITLQEFEARGREFNEANPEAFSKAVESIHNDHLATLIYTSGTTGKPKGVELIHDCWVYEAESMASLQILDENDHQYLWLPLAHSFGKVLEAGQLRIGLSTTVDGRIPKLVDNLAVVKPTFMAAAPRIFEKVYNKVVSGAQDAGGLKYKIFTWAVAVGLAVSKLRQAGSQPGLWLGLKYKIAHKLVFSKLHARFGGRLRFFISGAAPLSKDIAEFFHAAGILILEGYGLTETSAASFVNRPDNYAFGTVGPPLPGTEVKIDPADGEVLIRGRGVMRGYHNMTDATQEALTSDGWLRTGDVGDVDSRGRLRITDRKKDLIKTSGGKYVAPQELESQLKALCPYVSQVVVHGDARNFCTALVAIDPEGIATWASSNGVGRATYRELTESPQVMRIVQEAVDTLNSKLASYQTIKKFALLPKDLTVEDGELTPSLKVKRKTVEKKYLDVLDRFYSDSMRQY